MVCNILLLIIRWWKCMNKTDVENVKLRLDTLSKKNSPEKKNTIFIYMIKCLVLSGGVK